MKHQRFEGALGPDFNDMINSIIVSSYCVSQVQCIHLSKMSLSPKYVQSFTAIHLLEMFRFQQYAFLYAS